MTKEKLLKTLEGSILQNDPENGGLFMRYYNLIKAALEPVPEKCEVSGGLLSEFKNDDDLGIRIRNAASHISAPNELETCLKKILNSVCLDYSAKRRLMIRQIGDIIQSDNMAAGTADHLKRAQAALKCSVIRRDGIKDCFDNMVKAIIDWHADENAQRQSLAQIIMQNAEGWKEKRQSAVAPSKENKGRRKEKGEKRIAFPYRGANILYAYTTISAKDLRGADVCPEEGYTLYYRLPNDILNEYPVDGDLSTWSSVTFYWVKDGDFRVRVPWGIKGKSGGTEWNVDFEKFFKNDKENIIEVEKNNIKYFYMPEYKFEQDRPKGVAVFIRREIASCLKSDVDIREKIEELDLSQFGVTYVPGTFYEEKAEGPSVAPEGDSADN